MIMMSRATSHSSRRRALLAACAAPLLALVLPAPASAADFAPPSSAVLTYKLHAIAKGFHIDVDSSLAWALNGSDYTLVNRGSFLFFSFNWASSGKAGPQGVQPVRYEETRNRTVKVTEFDVAAGKLRFPGGQEEALKPGMQDRMSVLLQLASLGRANASALADGKVQTFRVAGSSESDDWHFRVLGRERIDTGMGQLDTVHLRRERDHDDGQAIEVWLAPGNDWLPVRVLSRETSGDSLDQVVEKIDRP
jgi:hypothetical protein